MSSGIQFDNNIIYKYGGFQDLERTLSNMTLGFSDLTSLNDPFESSFNHIHCFDSQEKSQAYTNDKNETSNEYLLVNKVQELVKHELSKYVITCFTSTPKQPLMWAHYAENHTGVCYCFDMEKLYRDEKYKLEEVQYSNKKPKVFFFEGSTTESQISAQVGDVICTKSDAWAYEEELRYIANSTERVHPFEPCALVGVVLGCRVSDADWTTAMKLVREYNDKNGQNLKLYHASMSGWLYEMEIQPWKVTITTVGNAYLPVEDPLSL